MPRFFNARFAPVAAISLMLSACAVQVAAPSARVFVQPSRVVYAPAPVVSVYIDPPLFQPEPIAVAWAPPPMLVEAPPPPPFGGAIWTGGYWTWHGNWVWAAGRWAAPPQPGYRWVQPYYEHRDEAVIFIGGHWSAAGVVFVPPPSTLTINLVSVAVGVVPGPRPIGPAGVFVPAPPGSKLGIIVPAPVGTAPAVVMSAPPVTNVGMRVQATINNTTNETRISNVTNVTNITNVNLFAPASAMASGKAYEANVPAQAHLAAALSAVSHALTAPIPVSAKPIPAFSNGRETVALPPPQPLRNTQNSASAIATPAIAPPRPATTPPAGVFPAAAPIAAPQATNAAGNQKPAPTPATPIELKQPSMTSLTAATASAVPNEHQGKPPAQPPVQLPARAVPADRHEAGHADAAKAEAQHRAAAEARVAHHEEEAAKAHAKAKAAEEIEKEKRLKAERRERD